MRKKQTKAKMSYDADADVLSFVTAKGKLDHVSEMWPLLVHFDRNNKPLYVELLDASRVFKTLNKSHSVRKAA